LPRYAVKVDKPTVRIEGHEAICDTLENLISLSGQFKRLPSQVAQFAAEPAQDGTYDKKNRHFTCSGGQIFWSDRQAAYRRDKVQTAEGTEKRGE
jgi:hypothetical protein